jgi:signal transduction histidine kinase
MYIVKNLTPVIRYEKLKIENHFYEMLTATVSHDMRTPLNSMIGLLDALDMFVTKEGKRFSKIIKNSTFFMLFLVSDLLDFFQIRNGKFKKNERLSDPRASFEELAEICSQVAFEKNVKLLVEIDDSVP